MEMFWKKTNIKKIYEEAQATKTNSMQCRISHPHIVVWRSLWPKMWRKLFESLVENEIPNWVTAFDRFEHPKHADMKYLRK